jgi:hypothetical protein
MKLMKNINENRPKLIFSRHEKAIDEKVIYRF